MRKLFILFLVTTISCMGIKANDTTIISVAEAGEMCKSLNNKEITTEYYEITGYVISLDESYSTTTYMHQSLYVADKDAYTFDSDSDAMAIVWRGRVDREVKRGYKVKIIARLQNYNGLTEFVQGTITILEDTEVPWDNKCGKNVTWSFSEGTLTIRGKGPMNDYCHFALWPWHMIRGSINNIVVLDSVSHIGDYAFSGCTGLTSMTIPNSVTSIGNFAFRGCTGLTSIEIPNSVTSIGNSAFWNCTGLTSIEIPNSVTSIGNSAFWNCTGLTSLRIPNSVIYIGNSAFNRCTGLTAPVYNDHVFAYMPTLYSGTYAIPDGIESISGGAFLGCSGLTSVTIGNSVTSIGEDVFRDCTNLTDIYATCGDLDRIRELLNNDSRVKYAISPYTIAVKHSNMGYVTIPEVISACDNVITAIPFLGYQFISWADGNTENPRTIVLTQDTTMEVIFDYLLTGKCGKDSALTWTLDTTTMALTIIGQGALSDYYTYNVRVIESLTIGNDVTIVGREAFEDCNYLKNVILGSSVKLLDSEAFKGGIAIESITCYSQRPPTVNYNALLGVDYSTIVYVPAEYLETYKMHDTWGLYDVRPLSAMTTETTDLVVIPEANAAEVVWPSVSGAETYELVIKDKSGNIICTLVFNAQGQLISIVFHAPGRDIPQQTQTAGFSFTVTGLEEGQSYVLTITSKDNNGNTLDQKSVSFTTGDEQGTEDINVNTKAHKLLRNGQILIQRGDRTYTVTGQELR